MHTKALVADDDPTIRDMLVRALEGWDFSVKAVAGGHEASEKALVERGRKEAGGNTFRAARMLGVDRRKLCRLLSKHGAG